MLRTLLLRPPSPNHSGSQYALLMVQYPSKRMPPPCTLSKPSMRCISSGRNVLPTLASRGLLQVVCNYKCAKSAKQHFHLAFERMSGPKETYHPISWLPPLRRRWGHLSYSFQNWFIPFWDNFLCSHVVSMLASIPPPPAYTLAIYSYW